MNADVDQTLRSIIDVHIAASADVISDVASQMNELVQTIRSKHRLSANEIFVNSSTDWMAVDNRFNKVSLRPAANRMITEGPATPDEDL